VENTASSYNNIGSVYNNKGDYDKANEYHQQSLAIRLKTLGEGHPHTAISYNNIGSVYNNKGDYDKAIEYYQRCLAIRLRTLGENHPSTTRTRQDLALIQAIVRQSTPASSPIQHSDVREDSSGIGGSSSNTA
jgi:tetratricopeptide (TPR) repeat protein